MFSSSVIPEIRQCCNVVVGFFTTTTKLILLFHVMVPIFLDCFLLKIFYA